MTLSCCMIVRDVADTIERCLDSVIEVADEVSVTDTGSEDSTIATLQNYCKQHAKKLVVKTLWRNDSPDDFLLDVPETWSGYDLGPYTGKWLLANFGRARELSWQAATSTHKMILDCGDIVRGAVHIPEIIESMKRRGIVVARTNYNYAFDALDNVTGRTYRERIIAADPETHWSEPIHEVLGPLGKSDPYPMLAVDKPYRGVASTFSVAHRNLKVLLAKGDKSQARTMFYLGQELSYVPALHNNALDTLAKYIEMSWFPQERARAHCIRGEIFEARGDLANARACFAQAAVDSPVSREGFYGLARCAYFKGDWERVIAYTDRGDMATGEPLFMCFPLMLDFKPTLYLSRAQAELRKWKACMATCLRGLEFEPQNAILLQNLAYAREQSKPPMTFAIGATTVLG